MPIRSKSIVFYTIGLLLMIGFISALVGFAIAVWSGETIMSTPHSASVMVAEKLETGTSQTNPVSFLTNTLLAAETIELRETSTPEPKQTVRLVYSPTTEMIVHEGESLYPVCRRNCSGLWSLYEVPQSLVQYAQLVCQVNSIPWNDGHPLVYTGQQLEMPPCPNP
jgi:hypothetical protein